MSRLSRLALEVKDLVAAWESGGAGAAVEAAELVGVPVPKEYILQVRKAPAKRTNGNGGSYRWEPGPLPTSDRLEDLSPRECEVSRAMWSYSRGSKGTAGKRGEGVLSAPEFWALVKEQTGKTELQVGEKAN